MIAEGTMMNAIVREALEDKLASARKVLQKDLRRMVELDAEYREHAANLQISRDRVAALEEALTNEQTTPVPDAFTDEEKAAIESYLPD